MLRIEIYEDKSGAWRWRALDTNDRIIADSAESYVSFSNAERALENVISEFRGDVQTVRRLRGAMSVGQAEGEPDFTVLSEYEPEAAHEPGE